MRFIELRLRSKRAWPRRIANWLGGGIAAIQVNAGQRRYEYLYRPFRGIQFTAVFSLSSGKPKALWKIPHEVLHMKRVKFGDGPPGSAPESLVDSESKSLPSMKALIAHCCVTRYEDGSPRKTGWFTIKTVGSQWCVQVKDPDSCASMTVMAPSLDDAMDSVELLLSTDKAPWEPDSYLLEKKPKGKK